MPSASDQQRNKTHHEHGFHFSVLVFAHQHVWGLGHVHVYSDALFYTRRCASTDVQKLDYKRCKRMSTWSQTLNQHVIFLFSNHVLDRPHGDQRRQPGTLHNCKLHN